MPSEMPCIRCGACASACPVQLQPQQLLQDLRAGKLARASGHGLFDCSECGHCDAICPSHIALLSRFQTAKSTILQLDFQLRKADAARDRFESRGIRLQRESVERAESEATMAQQASSIDAVAAAIERAKARRQQSRDKP